MSHYTALLDANMLYPAPLRDLLMQLAVTDLFKAKWTADIHREWIDAILRNDPHRDRAALEPFGIEAQHPDEFLSNHLNCPWPLLQRGEESARPSW